MRRSLLILALALPLFASIPLPPAPTRYVTDAADLIPDDREHALNEKLAEFDRTTTNQIIVYVDRRVPAGTTLEEMGAEAIRTWAVGQEKRDNGAILFLFVDDRQSRIEVGYGLEGTLTDARSKRILVSMREALRAGDYAGAIESGAGQISNVIKDPGAADPVPPSEPVETSSAETSAFGVVLGIFFLLIVGAVLVIGFRKSGGGTVSTSSGDDSSSSDWSSSSFGDSSSSSSSSSSDFSGGGGSGGGGGASDKW
jgi:uncharacterized protein